MLPYDQHHPFFMQDIPRDPRRIPFGELARQGKIIFDGEWNDRLEHPRMFRGIAQPDRGNIRAEGIPNRAYNSPEDHCMERFNPWQLRLSPFSASHHDGSARPSVELYPAGWHRTAEQNNRQPGKNRTALNSFLILAMDDVDCLFHWIENSPGRRREGLLRRPRTPDPAAPRPGAEHPYSPSR